MDAWEGQAVCSLLVSPRGHPSFRAKCRPIQVPPPLCPSPSPFPVLTTQDRVCHVAERSKRVRREESGEGRGRRTASCSEPFARVPWPPLAVSFMQMRRGLPFSHAHLTRLKKMQTQSRWSVHAPVSQARTGQSPPRPSGHVPWPAAPDGQQRGLNTLTTGTFERRYFFQSKNMLLNGRRMERKCTNWYTRLCNFFPVFSSVSLSGVSTMHGLHVGHDGLL